MSIWVILILISSVNSQHSSQKAKIALKSLKIEVAKLIETAKKIKIWKVAKKKYWIETAKNNAKFKLNCEHKKKSN